VLVPAISKLSWAKTALLRMSAGTTTLTVDDPGTLMLAGLAEHVSVGIGEVVGCWPEASAVTKKLVQARAIEPENPPVPVAVTVKFAG
jgi:hypothetical protein